MLSNGIVACILVGACGGDPSAVAPTPTIDGPRHGGQIVVGRFTDVATFNPYQAMTEAEESQVQELLFPALMTEQADYQLHPPSFAPRLASSWEFSHDNLTLTFHLRPEARWSDGVPVTAEDVRFTHEVQRSPAVGWIGAEIKSSIVDVQVVDTHTVQFRFTRVYPYQLMDANDGLIMPKHTWGAIPLERWPTEVFDAPKVTCGPFRLAAHTPQQTIALEREPLYWAKGLPNLDKLVLRVIPDSSSQVSQLLAGDLQLVYPIVPADAQRIKASPEVELVELPSRLWGFVAWNNRSPLFSDRRVRRALSLAINRKSLVDSIYLGYARLAVGPVLSSFWAFNRNLPQLPFDQSEAKRLLLEAGWRDSNGDGVLERNGRPFRFDLSYPAVNSLRARAALLIQADLARVGIEARPHGVEFTALMTMQDSGTFQASLSAWEEATKVDLSPAWATKSDQNGLNNFPAYSNPEVDRLLLAVRDEPEFARAKVLLDRIQELIVEDQPVTFLYEAPNMAAISRRLRGADLNASTVFFNVEEWYWSL